MASAAVSSPGCGSLAPREWSLSSSSGGPSSSSGGPPAPAPARAERSEGAERAPAKAERAERAPARAERAERAERGVGAVGASGGLVAGITAAAAVTAAAASRDRTVLLRQLRGGVNAAVPAAAAARLRGVLGCPVRLRLHERSAGGTYMVCFPATTAATATGAAAGTGGETIGAVFKPRAEEIGQERNPHGNCTSERAAEFVPGTGSRREVLAFLLDHEGSAGVMPAIEACVAPGERAEDETHVGSLLLFAPGCVEAADVLPGGFAVEEVHRIAIFDIRTLNSDRHGGNVLVCYAGNNNNNNNDNNSSSGRSARASPHLVPIDHSYICPAGFADPDFEWLSWPQAKVPFSPASRGYIARLDEARDAAILRAALGRSGRRGARYGEKGEDANEEEEEEEEEEDESDDVSAAEEVLRCTTRLLRVAALEYGMSAHDIGQVCRRRTLATPSMLEELIEESRDEAWHVQYARFEEMLHARLKREGRMRSEGGKEETPRGSAKTGGCALHGMC